MNIDFKQLLQDLKERELYIPLVVIVAVAVLFILLVNRTVAVSLYGSLKEKNDLLAKKVSKYHLLKENEAASIAAINAYAQKLKQKFDITESIYVKSQSHFELYLKGSEGILSEIEKKPEDKELFSYKIRSGQPVKTASYLRYQAEIMVDGTMNDIYRLLQQLERKDRILLEVKEMRISYIKYLTSGKVQLQTVFRINAYQRQETRKKKPRRKRTTGITKDVGF